MSDHESQDPVTAGEIVPAARFAGVELEPEALRSFAEQLVEQAAGRGIALTGEGGLLTSLTRQVLQSALEAELSAHLGYDKHDPAGRNGGNSRNGSTPKTVRTEVGELTVRVPRDRAGTFEPQIIPKNQRRLSGFDENVVSLYAKGMTTGDICSHLSQVYDTDISKGLITAVTEQVGRDLKSWQSRPLDPVILIDAIVLKVRDGAVGNRPVYVAMGITLDGERDVLGMWVGPTGGEGAKQWMNLLTELKNRGILDVCIVCCDGLKGLPDAIRATWPLTEVQTCVVHLVRNSLRYASKKHWSAITTDLRRIYTAPSVAAAEDAFLTFADTWEDQYPAMVEAWKRSWEEFIPFLEFPPEIRKLIYTTNAIESLNSRFRAATRRRGHFPDEDSALKVLYLAVLERQHNRPNPTGRINGWKAILNVLTMTYGDRLRSN
jgi:transposase-like protein